MKEDVKVKYEKELMYVKNYISLNPGFPKFLVSAKTHVESEIIDQFIDEGILLEEGGILKLPTRQTIKGDKRKELLTRLKESVNNDNMKNATSSRLIEDLETRRNVHNRNDEEER